LAFDIDCKRISALIQSVVDSAYADQRWVDLLT